MQQKLAGAAEQLLNDPKLKAGLMGMLLQQEVYEDGGGMMVGGVAGEEGTGGSKEGMEEGGEVVDEELEGGEMGDKQQQQLNAVKEGQQGLGPRFRLLNLLFDVQKALSSVTGGVKQAAVAVARKQPKKRIVRGKRKRDG